MVKTSENDFQTLQHTCIGTFNNPLGPFRNLSSFIAQKMSFVVFIETHPQRTGDVNMNWL
jgi:hypothetical protein